MALMPGAKPFQSKLIPYLELIRDLRSKRTPYPEIARILREEHELDVGATTIFDFVKVRSKRREVYEIAADPPAATSPPPPTAPTATPSPQPPPPPPSPTTTATTDTQEPRHEKRRSVSAAKEAIAARRQAAENPASSEDWAAFKRDVDPTKPLTFINPAATQSNDTHAS